MSAVTLFEAPVEALFKIGINTKKEIHYQNAPEELTQQALKRNEGVLNDTGALIINTGEFTGRSPKDKFIVIQNLSKRN